jgi:uncharacterized peroxidase-related enzyme
MSRINVVESAAATPEQKALLDAIQSQLGMVPNFLKVFANSPTALQAFLGLYGVANAGSLDPQDRERIALAMAQQNGCQYCVSAHTAIGRKSGLTNDEMAAARLGTSEDPTSAAILKFARSLMAKHGEVSALEITELRMAGVDEAQLVEIITHVGMNFLTNILGKASLVEIDFPTVKLELA